MFDGFDRQLTVSSSIGTQLWVGIAGRGPAVMLCDGLGCDGFIFRHMIADLRRDFTVIRWHYRGHGRSAIPDDLAAMSVEGLASDLPLVLDAVEVDRAMLIGHSMGVQVILEAALGSARDRTSGLGLLCGAPGRPLDTFKNSSFGNHVLPVLQHLAHRYPREFRAFWRTATTSPLTLFGAKLFEINAELMKIDELRPYLQRLGETDPVVFLAMTESAASHSVESRLDDVAAPTLVVAAEHDTFTPMHRSVAMARAIAGSELFVLPGATHTGPLEWPDMLSLRLRKFMRERVDFAPRAKRRVSKPRAPRKPR